MSAEPTITGREHWTHRAASKLFLWDRAAGASPGRLGTSPFVHGSSMASTPTFDLQVPGRADASAIPALDDAVPTGTYVDMGANLPAPVHRGA